jgi:hypothetical protein
LIARVIVGATGTTGFDAYPLVDPAIVGDASGNGGASLSAFDTSLIAQESAGINTPEVPDGTAPGSGGSALYDPQLSIPDNIPVVPGHRYHFLDVYRQVSDRRFGFPGCQQRERLPGAWLDDDGERTGAWDYHGVNLQHLPQR